MLRRFLQRLTTPRLQVVGKKPSHGTPRMKVPRLKGGGCQWRADGQKNASFRRWRCASCGVEAYSSTGKAPDQCKKGLDGRL